MIVAIFIGGLIIGSFLNVLALRIPLILKKHQEQTNGLLVVKFIKGLALPSSHCPECKANLGVFELVPVISYLWQKGRCRHCKKRISVQYPLVEALSAFLAVWAYSNYSGFAAVWAFIFFAVLLVLTIIDFKSQILPDEITLPLIWLGILLNTNRLFVSLDDSVIGAAAAYLSLWLIYQVYYLIRKREGLGYGDFKLLAAIGAWFGWQQLPLVVFFAAIFGIIYFVFLYLKGKVDQQSEIAFGPFLAVGIWMAEFIKKLGLI